MSPKYFWRLLELFNYHLLLKNWKQWTWLITGKPVEEDVFSYFSLSLCLNLFLDIFPHFPDWKTIFFYEWGKKGKHADLHCWLLAVFLYTNRCATSNAGIPLSLLSLFSPFCCVIFVMIFRLRGHTIYNFRFINIMIP